MYTITSKEIYRNVSFFTVTYEMDSEKYNFITYLTSMKYLSRFAVISVLFRDHLMKA